MTPIIISKQYVSILDLVAFKRVCAFVDELPDHEKMTCHVVTRLARIFAPRFRVIDGQFTPGWNHSWLQRDTTIIDPSPCLATGPLMVTTKGYSHWRHLYIERFVGQTIGDAEEFVRSVRIGTLIL